MENDFPEQYRARSLEAIRSLDTGRIAQAIEMLVEARAQGSQIFVCGNGGSAAAASHFACEMLKGASYNRERRFRILALTDSLPTITAYSNDVSYECVFVEQLKNFARPGDIVIAISGSGNSGNVVRALEYGNSAGCRTIAFTGSDGGRLGPLAGLHIHVPIPHIGHAEDAHLVALHMICYYFMEKETASGRE